MSFTACTHCCVAHRGVKKYGGKIQLNAHVDHVLMERGCATGVVLKSGQVIKTRKVVALRQSATNLVCCCLIVRLPAIRQFVPVCGLWCGTPLAFFLQAICVDCPHAMYNLWCHHKHVHIASVLKTVCPWLRGRLC